MGTRVLLCGGLKMSELLIPISRGFRQIGCELRYFPTRTRSEMKGRPMPDIHARLSYVVQEFAPDILYWIICKWDCPRGLIPFLKLMRPDMKAVFHSFDDPFQIEDARPDCIQDFDAATTCCKGSVKDYESLGVPVVVAYPPPDRELHHRVPFGPPFHAGALMACTNVYPKEKFPRVVASRADIARAAYAVCGDRFNLYGYWGERRYDWGGEYGVPELKDHCFKGWLRFEDQGRVFARTKVNINSHVRPDGYQYMNERCSYVMGSGGFMLCDRVAGLEELFEPGVHCDYYGSIEEFTEKLRYWLAHDKERMEIAVRGKTRLWNLFGQQQHAQVVLNLVESLSL